MAKRTAAKKRYPDLIFLFLASILVFFGLLMVFSAATTESLRAGDPLYYFKKQTIYVILGGIAMLAALRIGVALSAFARNAEIPPAVGSPMLNTMDPLTGCESREVTR